MFKKEVGDMTPQGHRRNQISARSTSIEIRQSSFQAKFFKLLHDW